MGWSINESIVVNTDIKRKHCNNRTVPGGVISQGSSADPPITAETSTTGTKKRRVKETRN